jgi:cation diffusion facilitator CzcD-associated flavoprotein CzcO
MQRSDSNTTAARSAADDVFDVAIIGAGFAGIGMAAKLAEAGIRNVVLLERAAEIGGTWRDNHYPGCACDIPSHLYSYSFRQNADWTRLYPSQPEIQRYLLDCVEDFALREKVRVNSNVVRSAFEEDRALWATDLADGDTVLSRVLVSAIGGLSRPATPSLPGLESYTGTRFHSADWDDDFDLAGKRVAVVGTGASAIQFVPRIATQVARLTLFQRTPPWIVPKPDRPVRAWERWLFRRVPMTRSLFRSFLYWRQEILGLGFTLSPRLMRRGTRMALEHIRASIGDPELRARVTPDYQIGCKRILLSDDYYPALERDNVELVTAGIERVGEQGITDRDGRYHEADVIIFATGFNAVDPLSPTRIFGLGGRELAEDWRAGPEAFLGISVSGYPNLFLLMGPNTGLGHNSVIFMIESQIRYSVKLIRRVLRSAGATVDVRADVQESFNQRVQRAFRGSVWASGCKSWYQGENGRQVALWPGFTFTYWFRTLRPKLGRYLFRS